MQISQKEPLFLALDEKYAALCQRHDEILRLDPPGTAWWNVYWSLLWEYPDATPYLLLSPLVNRRNKVGTLPAIPNQEEAQLRQRQTAVRTRSLMLVLGPNPNLWMSLLPSCFSNQALQKEHLNKRHEWWDDSSDPVRNGFSRDQLLLIRDWLSDTLPPLHATFLARPGWQHSLLREIERCQSRFLYLSQALPADECLGLAQANIDSSLLLTDPEWEEPRRPIHPQPLWWFQGQFLNNKAAPWLREMAWDYLRQTLLPPSQPGLRLLLQLLNQADVDWLVELLPIQARYLTMASYQQAAVQPDKLPGWIGELKKRYPELVQMAIRQQLGPLDDERLRRTIVLRDRWSPVLEMIEDGALKARLNKAPRDEEEASLYRRSVDRNIREAMKNLLAEIGFVYPVCP